MQVVEIQVAKAVVEAEGGAAEASRPQGRLQAKAMTRAMARAMARAMNWAMDWERAMAMDWERARARERLRSPASAAGLLRARGCRLVADHSRSSLCLSHTASQSYCCRRRHKNYH